MKRIAFIIGDGRSGGDPLPGVYQDHRNYRDFLLSNEGGAWASEEILNITKPIKRERLLEVLSRGSRFDFAFVAFSGHGFTHKGRSYICVSDGDAYDDDLVTGATRQVTIIDACREASLAGPLIKSERILVAAAFDDYSAEMYRASCRKAFDIACVRAPEGESRLYACSPGQAAGEGLHGGYFSHTLIQIGTKFSQGNGICTKASRYLPLNAATNLAIKAFARYPQTPLAHLGRRQTHFPFAVY